MHRILTLLAFLLMVGNLAAQKIENVRATVNGDDIIIMYDLSGNEGQLFTINLYASNTNFSKPIVNASGDIGSKITPGKYKRVVWNAKNEIPDYKGDLVIEVRGEAGVAPSSVRPLSFLSPTGGGVKRGKNLDVSWTGGTPSENVELSLVKNGVVMQKLANQMNSGGFSWQVPKETEKGTYQLKLTGTSSGDTTSPAFKVKPKTPFIVKMLPFLAVGGAAAVLLSGGSKKTSDLPVPPEPN